YLPNDSLAFLYEQAHQNLSGQQKYMNDVAGRTKLFSDLSSGAPATLQTDYEALKETGRRLGARLGLMTPLSGSGTFLDPRGNGQSYLYTSDKTATVTSMDPSQFR